MELAELVVVVVRCSKLVEPLVAGVAAHQCQIDSLAELVRQTASSKVHLRAEVAERPQAGLGFAQQEAFDCQGSQVLVLAAALDLVAAAVFASHLSGSC